MKLSIAMVSGVLWQAAVACATGQPGSDRPLEIRCADEVSAARMKGDVETLAGFGTRHTLSDTASPTRGIGAARRWIKGELAKAGEKSGGRMSVELEEFDVPEGKRIPKGGAHLVNVVGVLRGVDEAARARRVYIVGHYDSAQWR